MQFREGVTGSPLLTENSLSLLEAEVFHEIDLGSHTIFIGNVVNSEVLAEGPPLIYRYYHDQLKGRPSKNAPTYVADQ